MIDFHTVYSLTQDMALLYIEDDPSFLEESSEVFGELFYTVHTATHGEEGLEKYLSFFRNTSKHYDIVVTDINMPKMDGIALIKKIYEIHPNQIIIVVSAHNEPQYLLELVNLGIEQFLLKPNNYDTILNVFHKSASKFLRSIHKETETFQISLGTGLLWDKQTSVLYENNEVIKLTKNETLLMQVFIKNRTKISTLQEIFDTLWHNEPHLACAETLKSIISRLRKKISTSTIENVYGLGYRLVY
ncbi:MULTISPECIES: response regulator transcription factor [unclassified Sulfurospirillum]|uniref:response regulator transcription factor n=1 Tax=unclassified Sulfurospirillum TaxID=2618290 RepID=UPI0025E7CEC5|nr:MULTISPECIES: response regulator transcription factor [unclassified Sulfurospirillum]